MPDISNPFFSLILQGIEDAALRAGYAVLVGDTQHDAARKERYALMLKRKDVARPQAGCLWHRYQADDPAAGIGAEGLAHAGHQRQRHP